MNHLYGSMLQQGRGSLRLHTVSTKFCEEGVQCCPLFSSTCAAFFIAQSAPGVPEQFTAQSQPLLSVCSVLWVTGSDTAAPTHGYKADFSQAGGGGWGGLSLSWCMGDMWGCVKIHDWGAKWHYGGVIGVQALPKAGLHGFTGYRVGFMDFMPWIWGSWREVRSIVLKWTNWKTHSVHWLCTEIHQSDPPSAWNLGSFTSYNYERRLNERV